MILSIRLMATMVNSVNPFKSEFLSSIFQKFNLFHPTLGGTTTLRQVPANGSKFSVSRLWKIHYLSLSSTTLQLECFDIATCMRACYVILGMSHILQWYGL